LLQSQGVEARDWFVETFKESEVDKRNAINDMFATVLQPHAHVDTDVLLYVSAFPQTRTIVIGRGETFANVIVYEPQGEIIHTIILGHQQRHFTALELADGDMEHFMFLLESTPEVARRLCPPPNELLHDWIGRHKEIAESRFGKRVVAAEVMVVDDDGVDETAVPSEATFTAMEEDNVRLFHCIVCRTILTQFAFILGLRWKS